MAARTGDYRAGSVGSGRRPSPQATRSALDGFRPTPDNREAGMSRLITWVAASGRVPRRALPPDRPTPRQGQGPGRPLHPGHHLAPAQPAHRQIHRPRLRLLPGPPRHRPQTKEPHPADPGPGVRRQHHQGRITPHRPQPGPITTPRPGPAAARPPGVSHFPVRSFRATPPPVTSQVRLCLVGLSVPVNDRCGEPVLARIWHEPDATRSAWNQ